MLFFLIDRASTTKIIVATINRILIKFPPMLKSNPSKTNNTKKPPNQRKKSICVPPILKITVP